ncbi:MAG: hypothetical protein MUR36_10280, partial [Paracoccaceae bacterium]|nr:hypothetical protein [Paracoccaceae bacterium]
MQSTRRFRQIPLPISGGAAIHNRPNGAPKLRPITVSDIFESLRAGLADFRAAPVPGLFFANFYVLGGLVMTWITYI